MVIIATVRGDLLDSKPISGQWYIAQQTNCNTKTPHGLSDAIAKKWSYANPYGNRGSQPDTPGSVVILEPPVGRVGPTVLCLMAQWSPSKPNAYSNRYPRTYKDSYDNRKQWFRECLSCLDDEIPDSEVVCFPYQIGCGLAGGKWADYQNMLEDCQTQVIIYQLP